MNVESRGRVRMLGFFRHKRDVVTVEHPPLAYTVEVGSFAHGACAECDWRGPARRARSMAEQDALTHTSTCRTVCARVDTEPSRDEVALAEHRVRRHGPRVDIAPATEDRRDLGSVPAYRGRAHLRS